MLRLVKLVVACVAMVAMTGHLHAEILYGVSLNGHNNSSPGSSSLYTINPVTGAGTQIGTDLGYAVNSIAIDPTSGTMYGSTTTWSGGFNGLLQIDPNTGTATEIGAFGGGFTSILGLSFDSNGNLFGWHDPGADDPVSINKVTGAATTVGNSGLNTLRQVLAFDSLDNLTIVQGSSVYDVNTTTGAASFTSNLSFDPGAGGAAFDFSTGLLWAPGTTGQIQDSFIRVTDLAGNSFTDIDTDVEYLNALTWGVTAVPEPTSFALFAICACIGGVGAARRRRREKLLESAL